MSTELWLGVIHYLLGVLVVLCLLVGLMEVSRKFDRFKDNAYLLLAIGYFLLLAWAMLRALSLTSGSMSWVAIACQLFGLVFLAFGYQSHYADHKDDDDDMPLPVKEVKESPKPIPSEAKIETKTEENPKETIKDKAAAKAAAKQLEADTKKQEKEAKEAAKAEEKAKEEAEKEAKKAEKKEKPKKGKKLADWMERLSVNSEAPVASGEAAAVVESDQSKPEEQLAPEAKDEQPADTSISKSGEDTPSVPNNDPIPAAPSAGPVDLSYLATRRRRGMAPVKTAEKKDKAEAVASINTAEPKTDKAKPEPKAEESKEEKVAKVETPAVSETTPPPAETRAQIMDDLFPLNNDVKQVPPPVNHEDDSLLPGEQAADATATKPTKTKKMPIGLMALGATQPNGFLIWPEAIAIILLLWLIIVLLPQRHHKGNRWLLIGFTLILIAMFLSLLYTPVLLGPVTSNNGLGYIYLGVRVVELLGFVALALASWQKIKGKVTHHFLKIVGLVYLVMLVLTLGLASVIVKDTTTLQLLLLLMSGVLITILPIIHSLTYNHPHQVLHDQIQQKTEAAKEGHRDKDLFS